MTGAKRKVSRLLGGVLIAGAIAAPLTAIALPSAGAATISAVTINSVTITGTAAAPVITVTGSGFGARPRHDPASHPNGQDGCPAFPANPPQYIKNDGYDYGSSVLYLWDTTAAWRGGNYVAGSELDCIGLRITTWTATKIVFRPGTAYDHTKLEQGHKYELATGDSVQVAVRGTTATITY
jgi:hypothetical protein